MKPVREINRFILEILCIPMNSSRKLMKIVVS